MTHKLIEVPLDRLHDHPHNSHVTTARERQKIANNIRRSGRYPPLTVRELTEFSEAYPGEAGHYQILDGHQRKQVFHALIEEGLDQFALITCDDWSPITDDESLLLLATLNSWGDYAPRRRAELLHAITRFTEMKDAADILPESERQINDALKLLKVPIPDIHRLIDQAEQPDLLTLSFVITNDPKAAVARFTSAIQLFAILYGATLTDVSIQEGGERGRVAVLTFQIQNAAKAIVEQALKQAGAGLRPGTKNRRGRSLEEMASSYLATHIEEEYKIPVSAIETAPPPPREESVLPAPSADFGEHHRAGEGSPAPMPT